MTLSQYYRLVDVQARMMLKADASRFKLGYLWWFLEPLMWVGVFYLVFNVILESGGRSGIDFLMFLICGKFAFIWFSRTVVQASNAVMANRSLVSKLDLPKSMFPMAAVQESIYRQLTVYLLMFAILVACGYPVTGHWLWLLPILLTYYLMIVACSLVGAYLVCIVRDFSKLIPLVMTFLLFTSGVFFDVNDLGSQEKTDLVLALNPLAFMLDAHRQALMYRGGPDLQHLVQVAVGSCLLILFMIGLLRRQSQYLALRVLS